MKCGIGLLLCALPLLAISPAELKIKVANEQIKLQPARAEGYNALALALTQRARETADAALYDEALAAVQKGFAIAPSNFEGRKMQAWAMLGKHDFAGALTLAEQLNKEVPDDIQVYGFLADANIELGNYDAAEKAAQWMLDLRPGNIPGLTRGAYLRELFGDLDGALDFMRQSFQRTRPEETEDRAWLLTHIGHLQLQKGDLKSSERSLKAALELFPDYHYALGKLAKVRMAQGEYKQAVELLTKRYEVAPHPENLYDLGIAIEKAAGKKAASATWKKFEQSARAEMDGIDNANRELIFYYLDVARKPAEALRIAENEVKRRKDVHTLDAYAWSLFKSGRKNDAKLQMDKALAVGVKDPEMLARASQIAPAASRSAVAVARSR